MDSGLTRAQTIVVFRGVKMAAEFTEHSLLKQDGRDVTEGVARMDLDSVAGGPDVGRPSGPPTEADFDNIELGLDHDITPTKLRLMAVETAVDIQNSGLDITRNRQHGHRIMSSEAIVTAQMVFGKLLENAQKNIILVLENARAYDIALCGGGADEQRSGSQAHEVVGRGHCQHYWHDRVCPDEVHRAEPDPHQGLY